MIEQRTARGSTLAVSVASLPAFTGEVRRTRCTAAPADDANTSATAPAAITHPTPLTQAPPGRRITEELRSTDLGTAGHAALVNPVAPSLRSASSLHPSGDHLQIKASASLLNLRGDRPSRRFVRGSGALATGLDWQACCLRLRLRRKRAQHHRRRRALTASVASSYGKSWLLLPQQACSSSLWSQRVGSASALVITSTSRRDALSPPPSSLMTSRVGIHHLAQSEPPRTTSVDASLRMSWNPQRSNSAGSF